MINRNWQGAAEEGGSAHTGCLRARHMCRCYSLQRPRPAALHEGRVSWPSSCLCELLCGPAMTQGSWGKTPLVSTPPAGMLLAAPELWLLLTPWEATHNEGERRHTMPIVTPCATAGASLAHMLPCNSTLYWLTCLPPVRLPGCLLPPVLVNLLACLAWLVAILQGPKNSWVTNVKWAADQPSLYAGSPLSYLASVYWVVSTVSRGQGHGLVDIRERLHWGSKVPRVCSAEGSLACGPPPPNLTDLLQVIKISADPSGLDSSAGGGVVNGAAWS